MNNHDYVDVVRRNGLRAKGKSELVKHLEGRRLTFKEAVYAKCFDCMGFFMDGRNDCKLSRCPLYPFMVFNPSKRKKPTGKTTGASPAE